MITQTTATRRHLSLLLTIVLITYTASGFACGTSNVIRSFRLAIAASGPLVNSLVSAGAIPQERAAAIIADFDAGAQCGLTLQEEFAATPKGAPDARARKLAASQKAFNCFRVILNRQNFAAHPRLQQVANIADGILASLVVFYSSGVTSASASSLPTTATIVAKDEKDLMRQMELQVEALNKAMQP